MGQDFNGVLTIGRKINLTPETLQQALGDFLVNWIVLGDQDTCREGADLTGHLRRDQGSRG